MFFVSDQKYWVLTQKQLHMWIVLQSTRYYSTKNDLIVCGAWHWLSKARWEWCVYYVSGHGELNQVPTSSMVIVCVLKWTRTEHWTLLNYWARCIPTTIRPKRHYRRRRVVWSVRLRPRVKGSRCFAKMVKKIMITDRLLIQLFISVMNTSC